MTDTSIAPEHTDLPWETIGEMLQDRFVTSAGQEAIVDGATRLTYDQLAERVSRVASALLSTGFKPGDLVVIWGPNCWQWVVSALACWWLGGIVVPVSARNRGMDLLPILQTTAARYLFSSSDANGANLFQILVEYIEDSELSMAKTLPDLAYAVNFEEGADSDVFIPWQQFLVLGAAAQANRFKAVSGSDICMVMFTSGTSGQAKGVMRGHRQVLLVRWIASNSRGFTNQDRELVITPFSHISGLNGGLIRCLLLGMTCIIMRRYDPSETVKLLLRESVTSLCGPPSLFTQLLIEERQSKGVLGKLRIATLNAAPCPASVMHELRTCGIGQLCSAYGLTEFEAACATLSDDSVETIATTVGKPVPGASVKILSDRGVEIEAGEVGEIYLGGYSLMQGYFKDEALTCSVVDCQGYFATGDLGRFDDEGYLQILGRKKDMIIVHGLNVYPAEVENQLMQSGMLTQAAVVGRANRLAGEESVAFVVPLTIADFDVKKLAGWARKNMAAYKLPGKFVVLDQMPLNANGKTDKLALRRKIA